MKKMRKTKIFTKKMMALAMAMTMVLSMALPSSIESFVGTKPIVAEAASGLSLGSVVFDEDGNASFADCTGTNDGKVYKSIVISFTKTVQYNEKIVLPSGFSGFSLQSSLSTDTTKIVNMTGGKTLPECAQYIKQIKYTNMDKSHGQNIQISVDTTPQLYTTFFFGDTGHYYQFVPYKSGGEKTWRAAYNEAKGMTYNGMQGYLATVTTSAEDLFLYKASGNRVGWLGGTRLKGTDISGTQYYNYNSSSTASGNLYSYWYWAAGPEKGMHFFDAATVSSTSYATQAKKTNSYGNFYFNWNNGEPNSSNNEYCLTTLVTGSGYSTGSSYAYSWNDLAEQSSTSGTYSVWGMFVEFGDQKKGNSSTNTGSSIAAAADVPKLDHYWAIGAGTKTDDKDTTDENIAYGICTFDGSENQPKCVRYGSFSPTKNVEGAIQLVLDVEDHIYDRQYYNGAVLTNKSKFENTTGAKVQGNIEYYKTDVAGTVGAAGVETGTKVTDGGGPDNNYPRNIGSYYARVKILNPKNGDNTATDQYTYIYKAFSILRDFNNYEDKDLLEKDRDKVYNIEREDNDSFGIISDGTQENIDNFNKKKVYGQSSVGSGNVNTNLRVYLATDADSIELYKLADLNWNGANGDYDDPEWVAPVKEWLTYTGTTGTGSTDDFGIKDYAGDSYSSPEKLSKATMNTWTNFFKAMLAGVTIGTPETTTSKYVLDGQSGNESMQLSHASFNALANDNAEAATTTASDKSGPRTLTGVDDEGRMYIDFYNLSFGTYAVMAKDGRGDKYTPLVVDITPDRASPWGSYYVKPWFYAYLKGTGGEVNKYFGDGQQSKTVAIGDVVDFTIDVKLPTYYLDRVTSLKSGQDEFDRTTLVFRDIISKAFSRPLDSNGELTGNPAITIKYKDPTNGTYNDLPTDPVDYKVFEELQSGEASKKITEIKTRESDNKTPTEIAAAATANGLATLELIPVYKINGEDVASKDSRFNYELVVKKTVANNSTTYTPRDNVYMLDKKDKLFKFVEPTTDSTTGETTFEIKFNSQAMKYWNKDVREFKITYSCLVTEDCLPASEKNTNDAFIIYERTTDGNVIGGDDDPSRVNAYTYGINLVKKDGATSDPLAGAKFRLYKEYAVYEKNGTDGYKDWESALNNGKASAPDGFNTYNDAQTAIAAAAVDNGADVIYRTWETEIPDTRPGAAEKAKITVLRVFKLCTEQYVDNRLDGSTLKKLGDPINASGLAIGEFQSSDSEGGVKLRGLDIGNYLLQETHAPTGYNELSDDMYFSIVEISSAEQNFTYNGSLLPFYESEDDKESKTDINESGYYKMVVMNYAGLVLPSTGGVGIWLFTIIGIMLMSSVIFVIIRRRKQAEEV